MKVRILILGLASLLVLVHCEPESFITRDDARLSFSVDTVYFDTVFTTLGTVTRTFTIHNTHKDFIRISSLELAGGDNSVFRINVDGLKGSRFTDIEIPPRDSIYIFVEATLDPNNNPDILLQQDSIVTVTNGNVQDVNLVAWGQDVHILRQAVLETQTWTSEKPYLILDYAFVDSSQVLTLLPGTRVYLHRSAILFVDGTLQAEGTVDQPVSFSGDRLEELYEDIPGQWGGIYFFPNSRENLLDHTEIRGATFGVWIDNEAESLTRLQINNSKIQHISSYGLLSYNAIVSGYNTVFANLGGSAILAIGGEYEFNHLTVANRWGFSPSRQLPSVVLSNYIIRDSALNNGVVLKIPVIRDLRKANFGNCIIWGDQQAEIGLDPFDGQGMFDYNFERCLGKALESDLQTGNFSGFINNVNPRFISWEDYNFELDTLSPAKDTALISISNNFPFDLNGNDRLADGKPDLGAFERIEEN